MAKKKSARRRKPISAFKAFYSATAFQMSCDVLRKQEDVDLYFWPANTCEAFSLELHLKALHRVRRRNYSHIHQVKDLYEKISKADKKTINYFLNKTLSRPVFVERMKLFPAIKLDVDSILTRANRMFIWSRYWHEDLAPDEDGSGTVSNFGVRELSGAICRTIERAKPSWSEAAMYSFGFFGPKAPNEPT